MATGTVKWFDEGKGYGFIAPDSGGKDVFVHARQVNESRCGDIEEGDKVEFDVENDKRSGKPQAVRLRRS